MSNAPPDYGLLRLKSKTARSAIVQKLATDFNLTPSIAETFYQQNERSLPVDSTDGVSLLTGAGETEAGSAGEHPAEG